MPTIIPQRVAQVRKAGSKSQSDVIRKAGISKRTLQRIESSRESGYTIHDEKLTKLARALQINPDVLTGELPLPEEYANSVRAPKTSSERTTSGKPTEIYHTRLAKLENEFVVVEFSESNPVGNVVARNIPDEATGLRLTSSNAMRQLLDKAYDVLAGAHILDLENYFEEEEYYDFLNDIVHQLNGPVSLNTVAKSEVRTLVPSTDVFGGIKSDPEDAI